MHIKETEKGALGVVGDENMRENRIEEELKKWYGTEEERLQEARWIVVKSMLETYPKLRKRVEKYLMEEEG